MTPEHTDNPEPMIPQPQGGSGELSPNDHLKMLIELIRPTGPELARRWLAALVMVPPEQRQAVLDAVEAQIAEEFDV